MTETEEFERDMLESARYRELDDIMRFTSSRDGEPLRWRRMLRFVLFFMILDDCRDGRPGAAQMMQVFLASGPPVVPVFTKLPPRTGARRRNRRSRGTPLRASRAPTR